MAIFKRSKNKKDGEMPSSPSPPRNHGGESGVSQRSTSGNSTASNGPYDKQPQGTLPDVIEDHLTVNSSTHRNISEDNGFSNGTAQHIVSTNGVKSPPPIGSGVPPKSSSQRVGGPNGVKSPVPTGSGPVMGAQNGGYNQNGQSSTALPTRNMSQSQYPWSQHLISNASPFPRYGHASNYIAARDGEVFVMGGLKGSNVFGDLWVIETGYLLDTEGCPSPRVGHASLTLGNAFIIYGGDTKIEESDILDDNLYLLNTTTLKWTVANPAGPRPSGRYGHTISTIGSKIYIFGGQLDDFFFDDLVCYDLTTLRQPSSKWQLISVNGTSPPPRTNHTMITFQDKLYLFGGTDGKLWYSDTWCYDPQESTWTSLECSGFIPAPCEGHSATIVGDIMYVFGGRSSQGNDLGTLSALKLTTLKWFTFQNLGPGPSPRSGHSMTAFSGNKILIMGGESPDFQSEDEALEQQNSIVYILDTARISYPPDNNVSSAVRYPMPNTSPTNTPITAAPAGTQAQKVVEHHGNLSPTSQRVVSPNQVYPEFPKKSNKNIVGNEAEARQQQQNSDETAMNDTEDDNKSVTTFESVEEGHLSDPNSVSPTESHSPVVATAAATTAAIGAGAATGIAAGKSVLANDSKSSSTDRLENSMSKIPGGWNKVSSTPPELPHSINGKLKDTNSDSVNISKGTTSVDINSHNDMQKSFSEEDPTFTSDQVVGQSTPRGSVHVDNQEQVENINQALERLKASNSWYENELAAARDAGYVPSSRPPVDILKLRRVSQRITHDNHESLSERDILLAALSELKEELQNVQKNVSEQASAASAKISQVERERDALQIENDQLKGETPRSNIDETSNDDLYNQKMEDLSREMEEHRKARMALVGDREALVEPDNLRLQNLELEKQLRDQTDRLVFNDHEISQLRHQLEDTLARSKGIEETAQDKIDALAAAGVAVTASQARVSELNRQVEEHRDARTNLEEQVRSLQQELDNHKAELENSQRELQNHKDLIETANEQAEHSSQALNSGISNIVALWSASSAFGGKRALNTEEGEEGGEEGVEPEVNPQHAELQKKLDDITALHKAHKEAAEKSSTELGGALEQIAELKNQLANTEQEKNALEAQMADLNSQLVVSNSKLDDHERSLRDIESNHEILKSQLSEQNDNNTKELQDKIDSMSSEHEVKLKDLQDQNDTRYAELEQEYVKSLQYFKNTEKALSKSREELSRFKSDNTKLQTELDDLRLRIQADDEEGEDSGINKSNVSVGSDRLGSPNALKYNNRQVDLQLRDLRAQVIILQEERDELRAQSLALKKKAINHNDDLDTLTQEIQSLQSENSALNKKLKETESRNTLLLNGKRLSKEPIIDPKSGQTLNNFSDELEQIRNQRQKLSSVLNED